MTAHLPISPEDDPKTPKYQQIVRTITDSVREGRLRKGDRIHSINELSGEWLLSRDTVQKAYSRLLQMGVIVARQGKGYFINRTDIAIPFKVLLLFNKISSYKKQVYESFRDTMGDQGLIDLKIHHFDTTVLDKLLRENRFEYDHFVIMPHFYDAMDEACKIIRLLPREKLFILDKEVPYLDGDYGAVYQDFQHDIEDALLSALDLLRKYERLVLVWPRLVPYPPEIVVGFRSFCMQSGFPYEIIPEITDCMALSPRTVYIVIEETDLVGAIRGARAQSLTLGSDVGLISYNDTPIKEILLDGITVVSTDHRAMGAAAATMLLEHRREKLRNPFRLIRRGSL